MNGANYYLLEEEGKMMFRCTYWYSLKRKKTEKKNPTQPAIYIETFFEKMKWRFPDQRAHVCASNTQFLEANQKTKSTRSFEKKMKKKTEKINEKNNKFMKQI